MPDSTVSLQVSRRAGLLFRFPLAAIKSLIGCIAALDSNHRLVLATDAAARRVVGLFVDEVDNSGGSAGDLDADVEGGCFLLANSTENAVTDAHVGLKCFVEDNQTVASAPGTNAVVAGIVAKVDADGVWVHMGPHLVPPPQTVSTIAAADATNEASAVTLANELKTDFNALHAALKLHGLVK